MGKNYSAKDIRPFHPNVRLNSLACLAIRFGDLATLAACLIEYVKPSVWDFLPLRGRRSSKVPITALAHRGRFRLPAAFAFHAEKHGNTILEIHIIAYQIRACTLKAFYASPVRIANTYDRRRRR
ncbi:hypothetical protein EVAR_75918_1 [Eumeta japonica]|uniref:Uncharacterized protein n=1 Tax=Eumeta variegata TaxID=151549 RepID=A0A4C1UW83_EUMVA|nr:hypothetical protein EVAR_75918_1 [Eumeta japonica]